MEKKEKEENLSDEPNETQPVDAARAAAATDDQPDADTTTHEAATMSKSQRKKLLKRKRIQDKKRERKEKEKAAKKAKAAAQGRDLEAERKFLEQRTAAGDRKNRLQAEWDSEKLPLAKLSFQLCIDCSFEDKMTEKELYSLASQIRYCYSYNKKSPNPCLWAATSLNNKTLALLEKEAGYSEWVNRCYTGTPQSLEEYYKDNIRNVVYLTSDSDNPISGLDNNKIYVIGGIVDRNRLKGIAMRRAQELGIITAKLPLMEHLQKMPATPVLTCNHVFDIMLKYRECGNNWGEALQRVLPSRKEAEFKKDATCSNSKES
jgi:tRNA (guanine9-N1)-methyltransferase